MKFHLTSQRNTKLKNVYNTSLSPIKSCVNCSSCKDKCYALKSYNQYPAVRNKWDSNLNLLRKDINSYFAKMSTDLRDISLTKKDSVYYRIHVAGDFISKKHVDMWILFSELYPKIKFLAFTKAFQFLPRRNKIPKNLNIMCSKFPGMKVPSNYPIAFTYKEGTEHKGTRFKRAVNCTGTCESCGVCFHKENKIDVKFKMH